MNNNIVWFERTLQIEEDRKKKPNFLFPIDFFFNKIWITHTFVTLPICNTDYDEHNMILSQRVPYKYTIG